MEDEEQQRSQKDIRRDAQTDTPAHACESLQKGSYQPKYGLESGFLSRIEGSKFGT